jgi:hypothetical protein
MLFIKEFLDDLVTYVETVWMILYEMLVNFSLFLNISRQPKNLLLQL